MPAPNVPDLQVVGDLPLLPGRGLDITAVTLRSVVGNAWLLGDAITAFCQRVQVEAAKPNRGVASAITGIRYFLNPSLQKPKTYEAGYSEMYLVPVSLNNAHWVLYVVRPAKKTLQLLDSLRGEPYAPVHQPLLAALNARSPQEPYTEVPPPSFLPQQQNGYDCGVFVCAYAYYLLTKERPPTQQELSNAMMPRVRRFILWKILDAILVKPA